MVLTVKDLQDKLKRCPPDALVAVDVNRHKQEVVLDVGSLFGPYRTSDPGESCRKAENMKGIRR